MGLKNCMKCCGGDKNMKDDLQNIVKEDEAEEVDEKFVFLEQFPTDKKIENPSVPFIGELPTHMEIGRIVDLAGEVMPEATRFSLNLSMGHTPSADVAFHFNPRFDQNYVARNSRFSDVWGQEEGASYLKNPFHRGKKFRLTVLAAEERFMLAVNGHHFCTFTYRTALSNIKTVQIRGDLTVETLEYRMVERFPEKIVDPIVDITPEIPLSESKTDKGGMPLFINFPSGFTTGQEIEIIGRPKLLPMTFHINLQSDLYFWPHPAVLFHFNPRFHTNTVVMNSWLNGSWGKEQEYLLLFRANRPFSLKIKCCSEEFIIFLDGVIIDRYRHRDSPDLIKAMYIEGDVSIKEITLT